MACTSSNIWHCPRYSRLLSWSCPRRSAIRSQRACVHGLDDYADAGHSSHHGRVSEATSGKRHARKDTKVYGHDAWDDGKSNAGHELGADVVWWNYNIGVLPRRSSWPMSGTFHNGQRFHWLWHRTHDLTPGWTGLVEAVGSESGVF